MSATATPISLSSDSFHPLFFKPQHQHQHQHPLSFNHKPLSFPFTPSHQHPSVRLQILDPYTLNICSSSPSSSSSSSSSSTSDSFPNNPSPKLQFLAPQDAQKLELLQHFSYSHQISDGSLRVGLMEPAQIDLTVGLLAESFAESMLIPTQYVRFLAFLVKQYVMERRALLPHMATLVGMYKGENVGEDQLAGTVEISFNAKGANTSPPTPVSPRDSPYICNMAVKKELRRRGIGWHLLKASEELISQMTSSREVYLHCRMIDTAPLKMYTNAGYRVVKTDSILTWLTLQRRKHLMYKNLPDINVHNLVVDLVDPDDMTVSMQDHKT